MTCCKTLSINVGPSTGCIDWTLVDWTIPNYIPGPDGTAAFSPDAGGNSLSFSGEVYYPAIPDGSGSRLSVFLTNILHAGLVQCSFTLAGNVSILGGEGGDSYVELTVQDTDANIYLYDYIDTNGGFSHVITLPIGPPRDVEIYIFMWANNGGAATTHTVSISGTITPG